MITHQQDAERLLGETPVSSVHSDEQFAARVEQWGAVVAMRHLIQDERDEKEKVHRDTLLAIQQEYNPLVYALRGREGQLKHEMMAYRGRAMYSIPIPCASTPWNGHGHWSVTAAIRRLFSRWEEMTSWRSQ